MATEVIIYTRFSPRRNADETDSCETQESICKLYAQGKGWTVRDCYSDENVSGSSFDRPGLAEAIEALDSGDILLVFKRDRLARDVMLAELTRRQVASKKAKIVAVVGDINGNDDDPTVIFVRQIMDAVAELERKQTSVRTSYAMKQHQKTGRRMSRYAPYGYDICPEDPTRLVENPEEQEILRFIEKKRKQGNTTQEVVAALRKSFPNRARAKIWHKGPVEKIVARLENWS